MAEADVALRQIGRGRSARVFLDRDEEGRAIVRKVFVGEGLSKVVLFALTGSANPYTWCEPAIRAAIARRRILEPLVRYWLGDRLRLPRTGAWRWNPELRAFELSCELIDGSHAPLRGPLADGHAPDPLRQLTGDVMRPLQQRLAAAGFDGLLWQAGLGNPVAASNFMLEGMNGERSRWVWIDLESGVPALFALNPLATLRFYLPKSLRHRRFLFDDVDVPALRRYLAGERPGLEHSLGRPAVAELDAEVEELDRQQRAWRAIPRHRRSIAYELARGRLTAERAAWYGERPVRWYARLLGRGALRLAAWPAALARRAWGWLRGLDLRRLARAGWRFALSQRYRAEVARRLVKARVEAWSARRFLDRATVTRLQDQLEHDDVSSYVTDFGVHLAIKPLIKPLQWFLVPALLGMGFLGPQAAAVILVGGGLFGRTLYTGGRLVQAVAQGQRRPWVALAVGMLPVVGNAAYPAQLLYCGTEDSDVLARFLIYDTLAATGRALPIWGGADSLTEHYANRLGDVLVRLLGRPIVRL